MRRALALLAVLALLALAGCSGTVSEADLAENATTNWSTSERAHLTVEGDTYRAVYRIENRTTVELYQRDAFGQESPLPISALSFRADNGTVYNHSAFEVDESSRRLTLELPARSGHLAYSAPAGGKHVGAQTVVTGAHRVTLPANTTVGLPVLSRVHPGNYTVNRSGPRTAIVWHNVTSDRLSVDFYHERDPFVLAALFGLIGLVLLAGAIHYVRALRRLQRRRVEAGLEFED